MDPSPSRVDSDVDLRVPADRTELGPHTAAVLLSIAVGGAAGALARYGLQAAFPSPATAFGWTTWSINVAGCALIGGLMYVVERGRAHSLARPFLGVGVLGGFTTFSAYAVDVVRAVRHDAPAVAALYLVSTPLGALLAVWFGGWFAAWVAGGRERTVES